MKKDGGPAFPSHGSMGEVVQSGMSLRDYFAAAAMQGMCSDAQIIQALRQVSKDIQISEAATMGKVAYGYADAMLAAREHT